MSSLPEPNEVIGANIVGINRPGLECCDDMRGAQMGECVVDSHDMSRPHTRVLTLLTSLFSPVNPWLTSKTKIFVNGFKLP